MPKDNEEPLIMASLFSRDWSAQRLGWLDCGRLLWPVRRRPCLYFKRSARKKPVPAERRLSRILTA